MSTKRWLPTMLRARKAVEDNAALQVAQSRRELAEAERTRDVQAAYLDALSVPSQATTQTFLRGIATSNAAAASFAAANHRVNFAESRLAGNVDELNLAAQRRKSVEKLSERVAEEARSAELAAAQHSLDDIATSRFTRPAQPEIS